MCVCIYIYIYIYIYILANFSGNLLYVYVWSLRKSGEKEET